ncbi:hypothetical protein H5410_030962 [Solanum commersonii]|uniref:RNase H type-1 domain-containing protein n=1 Tax=Solanum commersonii TaxID=4109 RepID=A0A9J5YIW7_SOLCO|nr:hypothetical protein H5410_030962 [Solanum commersonii]
MEAETMGVDKLISTYKYVVKQWRIPWLHAENIENIQQIIARKLVQVKNIFREANQLADYLANMALIQAEQIQVNNFYDLPSIGRRILNIEKQHIPSLRIKARRINLS